MGATLEVGTGLAMVEATPSVALRPYVTRLVAYRERYDQPLARTEYAGAGAVFILGFGEPLQVDGKLVTSFTGGLTDRPTLTCTAAPTEGVEVFLTPFGARRLFQMPMSELTNLVVPVEDLLGPWGRAAVAITGNATSWQERLRLTDRLLVERILAGPALGPQIPWAWGRLLDSGGLVSVASLAHTLGWSHRHLVSRFHDQVGLSPKAAARVIRFGRALGRLHPGVSLAELATECGFYDQAHMNREFRAMAGTTPGRLLRSDSSNPDAILMETLEV